MVQDPERYASADMVPHAVKGELDTLVEGGVIPVASPKAFPVVEIFGPTIQGEGAVVGTVSHFVRFGGCSYRCIWCDSMHAVDPQQIKENARKLTSRQIMDELLQLTVGVPMIRPYWVTLSGGDPCMWQLSDLVIQLQHKGYKVAVETQGALWRDWLREVDLVTLSPKPPSSGMDGKLNPLLLNRIIMGARKVVLKIVIFTEGDLTWAREIHKNFPEVQMYLSAGTTPAHGESQHQIVFGILNNLQKLVDWVKADPYMYDCIVLPQVHALLWGHMKGV